MGNFFSDIGHKIFGSAPAQINPPSEYDQIGKIDPGLSQQTGSAESYISSLLSGTVPGDVSKTIKNAGATWGVNSGMPGSGMEENTTLESLGLTSLNEKQQGLGDYTSFLGTLGPLQSASNTTAEIANRNASAAASPNPLYSGIFDTAMGMVGSGVGGGGGGGGGGM
jgi:hypothetical protein